LSWYSPKPKQKPKRLPRRRPIKTIPSGIGDKGIVGNWLFYYLKGGDHLHDFSPYGNHGTINGAKFVDGRYGWALDLDGVDDYVRIGNPPSLNPDYITITAWIMGRDFDESDVQSLVEKPYTSLNSPFHQYILGYNSNNPYTGISVGGSLNTITGSTTLTNGNWYHLAMTFDGSNLRLYVNGKEDPESPLAVSGTIDSYDTDLEFGRLSTGGGHEVDGKVVIVCVYKLAKSASWIERRFERTKSIFGL